jgi:hypothetical protein
MRAELFDPDREVEPVDGVPPRPISRKDVDAIVANDTLGAVVEFFESPAPLVERTDRAVVGLILHARSGVTWALVYEPSGEWVRVASTSGELDDAVGELVPAIKTAPEAPDRFADAILRLKPKAWAQSDE